MMNERGGKNALEFSAPINLHANCGDECCTIVRLDSASTSVLIFLCVECSSSEKKTYLKAYTT